MRRRKPLRPSYCRIVWNAIEPAGKHLVDVALVADVEDELVLRRVEDAMQRDGQLDHAEVRSEMAAGLREDFDQLIAHFLRELRQILFAQALSRRPANEFHRANARCVCRLGVAFSEESDFVIVLSGSSLISRADLLPAPVQILSRSALPALLRVMISILCSAVARRSWQTFTSFIPSS